MKKNNTIVAVVVIALGLGGITYHVDKTSTLSQDLRNAEESIEVLGEKQTQLIIQSEELFDQLEISHQENFELQDKLNKLEDDLNEKNNVIEEKDGQINQLEEDLEAKIESDRLVAQAQEKQKNQEQNDILKDNNDSKEVVKVASSKQEKNEVVEEVKEEEVKTDPAVEENKSSVGDFVVTHYAIGDGMTPSTITANGTEVANTIHSPEGHRIIAVDTNIIPMNSIVEVTLNGHTFTAKASDTGSAINGKKIDLLVGSPSEALSKGVQKAEIKIVE